MTAPRNVSEVGSFLGSCGDLRRFIRNYSDLARPLHKLTCKWNNKKAGILMKWRWGPVEKQVFQNLIRCLCSEPIVLVHPNPNVSYDLYIDASDNGLGEP